MDLAGATALITGAASGIGLALSEESLRRGAGVVMVDVEEGRLQAEAARLRARGTVTPIAADVAQREAWSAIVGRSRAVDLLIANAGVGTVGVPVWELTAEDWQWVLGVNLWGTLHAIDATLPGMVERDRGHVVIVSSAAGLLSPRGMAPYTTSKHALTALAETLHHELTAAGSAVGVTLVCPGLVKTRMADNERNRPPSFEPPAAVREARRRAHEGDIEAMRLAVASGRDPAELARQTLDAVEQSRFYVILDDWIKDAMSTRAADIAKGRPPTDPS